MQSSLVSRVPPCILQSASTVSNHSSGQFVTCKTQAIYSEVTSMHAFDSGRVAMSGKKQTHTLCQASHPAEEPQPCL